MLLELGLSVNSTTRIKQFYMGQSDTQVYILNPAPGIQQSWSGWKVNVYDTSSLDSTLQSEVTLTNESFSLQAAVFQVFRTIKVVVSRDGSTAPEDLYTAIIPIMGIIPIYNLNMGIYGVSNPPPTPTAAQVGALPISGGALTGNLSVSGTLSTTGQITSGSILKIDGGYLEIYRQNFPAIYFGSTASADYAGAIFYKTADSTGDGVSAGSPRLYFRQYSYNASTNLPLQFYTNYFLPIEEPGASSNGSSYILVTPTTANQTAILANGALPLSGGTLTGSLSITGSLSTTTSLSVGTAATVGGAITVGTDVRTNNKTGTEDSIIGGILHNNGYLYQKTGGSNAYRGRIGPSTALSASRSYTLPNSDGTIQISSSDIRLKENISDSEVNALNTINQIKMRQFDWKEDGHHQNIGFVADELEAIDQNLAVGGGYFEDGEMYVKCVNDFHLIGYVVKALQELSQKVQMLEEENLRLKNFN